MSDTRLPSTPPSPPSDPAAPPPAHVAARLRVVQGVFAGALLFLAAGFAQLQLVKSEKWAALERRQVERLVLLPAHRGSLLDRKRRVLAEDRPQLEVALDPTALRDRVVHDHARLIDQLRPSSGTSDPASEPTDAQLRLALAERQVKRLEALLQRDVPLDPDALRQHLARERTAPFVLARDLTTAEAASLQSRLTAADPLRLLPVERRVYPHHHLAAHALGWVRRVLRGDAPGQASRPVRFETPGEAGVAGLEKVYDGRLRGTPGRALLRVDAFGYAIGVPERTVEPVAGADLVLSLDLDLQTAADQALAAIPGSPRGAAVAIDVRTGEVLALVSKPDFDLNQVSPSLSSAVRQRIEADGAWFNRAVQGLYPPGSTFKLFTALAGLRTGTLEPATVYSCDGYLEIGGRRFVCHQPEGHGPLTLVSALAHSCNVFAWRAGLAAGPEALAAEARRFHLGAPTGIDLPGEPSRLQIPDPAWKERASGTPWTAGDTANVAIGQGFLRLTPLQAACAIASLARRETLTVPTLLHEPGRKPTGAHAPEPLGVKAEDYAALVDGMRQVVETGIGREAQVPGVRVAGKTGTAQVDRGGDRANVAWFVGFAPIEHPEIAVAIAIEAPQPNVEFAGGAFAAPVARELLGTYFDQRERR